MKFKFIAFVLFSLLNAHLASAQNAPCPPIQDGGYTIYRNNLGCPILNPEDAQATWDATPALERFDREYSHFVHEWKPRQLGVLCQLFGDACRAPEIMRHCPQHGNGPGYPEDCRPSQAPVLQQISASSDGENQFWSLFNSLPTSVRIRVYTLLSTLLGVIDTYSNSTVATMTKLNQNLYAPLIDKLRRGQPLTSKDKKRLQDASVAFNQTVQLKTNNIETRLATLRALLKFSLPISLRAFGDINKDGSLDQAFVYSPSQQVVILLYHREYKYYYPTQVLSLPDARGVALADVNGDSQLDLVVRFDAYDIQLLGNGRGGFGPDADNPQLP